MTLKTLIYKSSLAYQAQLNMFSSKSHGEANYKKLDFHMIQTDFTSCIYMYLNKTLKK